MATQEASSSFREALVKLEELDRDAAFRTDFGEKSVKESVEPVLDEILERARYASKHIDVVHDGPVKRLTGVLNNVANKLQAHAEMSDPDFLNSREELVEHIRNQSLNIKQDWPHFIVANLESRGALDGDGFQGMESRAQEIVQNMEKRVNELHEAAEKKAAEIENRAKVTAAGGALKEAQTHFSEASDDLRKKAFWALGATLPALMVFLIVAWRILATSDFSNRESAIVLADTILRAIILSAVGYVVVATLRIYRGFLHMRELNLHRRRLASMAPSIADAAGDAEERRIVLVALVEEIARFGSSGLVAGQDDSQGQVFNFGTLGAIGSETRGRE